MMLSVSGLMDRSVDGGAVAEAHESAVPGGGEEESERSGGGGGNRWPKQETLALLKIRFDMDVAFRDSNFKGPLWEEVSRKMTELGFQRSGKKCREKFENVNKYHKRTKDCRASNPVGKTYRFFDILQAWESTRVPLPVLPALSLSSTSTPPVATTMTAPLMQTNAASFPVQSHVGTVPSISPDPLSIVHPNNSMNARILLQTMNTSNHSHMLDDSACLVSNSISSSTSSDEGIKRQRGKKRKWKDFFGSLIKNVFDKQEELHKKFLDTLDKRERDQMAREEEWRNQETERISREHELLVQERSISAAKDAAVVAFLHKLTAQSNLGITRSSYKAPPLQVEVPETGIVQPPQQISSPPPQLSSLPPPTVVTERPKKILNTRKTDLVFGDSINLTSSLRWPQSEVEALINLRTNHDFKNQEKMPNGPLWEEISTAMGKLGYNRSSKRCKEKWENINKHFKKVKESNKKRPEESKTCPYFHRLDALQKKRRKSTDIPSPNHEYLLKPSNPMVPIMARPEQQYWPVVEKQQQDSMLHDQDQDEEIENIGHEEEEGDGGG